MVKRDQILSAVIIVVFVGVGYVLYTGLFKEKLDIASISSAPDIDANKKTIVNLLPYGNTLEINSLKKRSEDLGLSATSLFTYPPLNKEDVGLPIEELLGKKEEE